MRRFLPLLLVFLLLCGCAGAPNASDPAPGTVRLCALNVGKADCLLLTAGDYQMVIDTGTADTADTVIDRFLALGVNRIDLLLLTHNDKDHIGGAAALLGAFPVSRVVQADYDEASTEYAQYTAALLKAKLTPTRLITEETLTAGGATVRLLPAAFGRHEQSNDYSVMTEITVGSRSMLLTGDAEKERLTAFFDQTSAEYYDVIKLPHHGDWNGATKKLLTYTSAGTDLLISTSVKEGIADKLKNWLTNQNRTAWYTYNGLITVLTDGTSLAVTQG